MAFENSYRTWAGWHGKIGKLQIGCQLRQVEYVICMEISAVPAFPNNTTRGGTFNLAMSKIRVLRQELKNNSGKEGGSWD